MAHVKYCTFDKLIRCIQMFIMKFTYIYVQIKAFTVIMLVLKLRCNRWLPSLYPTFNNEAIENALHMSRHIRRAFHPHRLSLQRQRL